MPLWLDGVRRDLQFGVRSLAKTPGVTALAVMSLALGIMATTAIYSVLHAVVIDPFPYKDVDSLTSVRVSSPAQRGFRTGYSVDQFLEIAGRATIFDGVIASTISDVLWTDDGEPQRLRGNHGTFNTFDVMGVPPLIGRTPTAADARPGSEPVVVLGFRFWQRQFGGSPDVIGRQLRLNDVSRTVIGVMPKRFMWRGADVYIPLVFERGRIVEGVRTVHLLGRLKPGVSDSRAEADLAPIIADLKAAEPTQFPDEWRVGLLPFKDTFPSAITREIWILVGAVGLLLLIACANVSNLLLSRGAARHREITVRAALGASRVRIVRQLLTESLMLAIAAGAIGTALAYAGLPALLALVPPGTIPDESEIVLNTPVLLFALGLSALTSLLCGLMPALHASRRDVAAALRESGRTLAGGSAQARLRKGLVVAEVALALMLLAGFSVLLRTFVALQQVELRVAPEKLLAMRVPLAPARYPDAPRRIAFFHDVLARIQALPGVAAVGLNTSLHPMGNLSAAVRVAGEPPDERPVQVHQVNAGYLSALGIRLAAGRLLKEADVAAVRPVALVNEEFARTRMPGRQPVGHAVTIPRLKEPPLLSPHDAFTIVGVVSDTPNSGLIDPAMPEIYVPFTAAGFASIIVVQARHSAEAINRSVVNQIYAVDTLQPVTNVVTLAELLKHDLYATPRFNLVLLSVFASCGLVLAIVGVYGVMSSAVAQEQQEIGVRLALGATSGAVARMILKRGFRLLAIGAAIGLAGAYAAGRWLAGEVWNVSAFDPAAFTLVTLILIGAGLQACFWPARRAARTDPLIAMRHGG